LNWIIIAVVIVMIIGPILYLLPTPKDKRLAGLREQARNLGLNVKLESIEQLDPGPQERVSAGGVYKDPRYSCAAYQLPMSIGSYVDDRLILLKIPAQPTVPFVVAMDGWALSGPASQAVWQGIARVESITQVLREILGKLPQDTLACAIDARFVACYWTEKADTDSDAVENIQQQLVRLSDVLIAQYGEQMQ